MERPFFWRRLTLALVMVTMAASSLGLAWPAAVFAAGDGPTIKDKVYGVGYPTVAVTANIPEQINAAYENIRWEIIGAGTMAFVNAMQMFFGQVAYDAADYLATGGKGQSALYYKKGFQGYLQDVAGSAAGEFIGSLSEASFFQTIGFDLCRPPDPRTLLRIQLSLGQFLPNAGSSGAYQRPQARCDFNDVVNNYEQVYQTLSNTDVLSSVEANLNTNANELGVSFLIFNRAQEFIYRRQDASEKDRKEGEGYQGLRDIISGRVRTPADTIREEANQVLVKDPKANQAQMTTFILNQAWEMGPVRLAMYTASVFLNTFTSRMLTRVMEDGIGIFDITKSRSLLGTGGGPDDLLVGNRDDVRKAFLDLRTPNLFRDVAFDVISEMQACPENRGTWSCTIDEGLGQALRAQGESGTFTIREALERNFLRADWRLFSSSNNREEKDPLCYTYGYCVGNLRKLRLMRILPAGFEFAANDPKNIARCGTDQGCVTLGEVVSGYSNCNARGEKDDEHPWCKLIDPNWALTSLPQQCALSGYGDVMLSGTLPQRREECQDVQTCLQRNDRGECVGGYGYCVAEKTSYRFSGQECSARYASCRTYSTRDGESQVSYLRNTLDYGNCSEDNVGCFWYATKRDPSGGRSNGWIGTPSSGERIYFDKSMEACAANGEGCTRLLAVRPGEQALNLVANSSFERVGSSGSALEAWSPFVGTDRAYVRPLAVEGDATADGALTATFDGGFREGYRQVVDLTPGRTYVLSGFVRRSGPLVPAPTATIALRQYRTRENALARTAALAEPEIARDYKTVDCRVVLSNPSLAGAIFIGSGLTSATIQANWSRIECAFTTNAATRAGEVVLQGTNVLIDAVQLEEANVASPYVDGLAKGLETVYHKVAPDEFACKGDASDSPLCVGYAKACRQTEASCNGYTDLNSAFPEVAAQVSPNDVCPAACVGYAEYRKLSSPFDLVQNVNPALNDASEPRSAFFIPTTAEQCTQEAVGCEEFTVVDGAQNGGETREYYNSLRFCEKPAEDSETYFTWEGSDSAGYQLRTWSLKRRTVTDLGVAPPDGETMVDGAGPRIIIKPSGELFQEKNPQDCNDANWRTGSDPDCRQFYNSAGRVFYRYYSQTVLSTPDCRQYRKANASEDDCRKTGGQYRGTEQACIYQAYAPESGSCSANYAGCRAYAGAEGGNLLTVFSANGSSTTALTNATVSSESLLVGDRSYRTDVGPGPGGVQNVSAIFPTTAGALYRVSFWAKSTAPATVVVNALRSNGQDARVVGTLRLTSEWQRVTFGAFEGVPGNRTVLTWSVSAETASAFFLDEIVVQQLRDVAFVRQGTWQTPNQCDQNAYGVPEPQAMAGCRAYRDREGQTVNARQFSQLCRPAAIGCREFVDTRNSTDPYQQTFNLADGAVSSVTDYPADRYIYLIDDRSKRCDASVASCQAFGKPVFSPDRLAVTSFETVYLKNNVERYSEGLCRPSELFCEEFTTASGREYFKDPQNHACEYRERVAVSGVPGVANGTYNGWFVKGGSAPCYPNALGSGQAFQLLNAGDVAPAPGFQGWGGLCPEEESECTEFRDPNDKPTAGSLGRAYYFLNNESVDTRSCNGIVDPARGCVPLRNMSDSRLLYSTEATLRQYQQENLQPVSPVNCQANPSAPGCAGVRTGRCVGTRVSDRYEPRYLTLGPGGFLSLGIIGVTRAQTTSSTYIGGSCSQESDCAPEATTRMSGRTFSYPDSGRTVDVPEFQSRIADIRCDRPSLNDANTIVKVKVDRDCAQWLGCATGETVYDPATNRYREICTKVALCDRAGEQGGSANYCSSYVNRTSTTTEPVLTAGAFFDAKQYTSRPTGIGARDYSGYSVPNAFQVVDLQSRAVAEETSFGTARASTERRLAVAVKMPPMQLTGVNFTHTIPATRPTQAELIPRTDPVYASVPTGMLLCRHRGTRLLGYFLRDEALRSGQEVNCYLSLRGSQEIGQLTSLQNRLSTVGSAQDLALDQAYPRALCRAYPESDAPFGNEVVAAWDLSTNPIRPKQIRTGYESAYACAYGENCSCSYKRVEYPGSVKPLFFGADSQAVPPGICVGGPRDGQACLPAEVFNISSSTSTSAKVAEAANNNQTCGPAVGGGRCAAFSRAEIVRGVMGSCLEYDTTRSRGKLGEETYACLSWNPSPIVGGQNDPYRYIQTAGYFPPQNSGQYYCASKARAPKSFMLTSASFGSLPSGISTLEYDDALVSDGSGGVSGSNQPGAYFEGIRPNGSQAAGQCEDADDDQDDDGPFERDMFGLRLVATGRGENANYTETFYGLSPQGIAASTYNIAPLTQASVLQRQQALMEQNMSYIEVRPFQNPNGNGRLACGYQADWVDGVTVDDYDDLEKTGPADRQWRSSFFAEEDLQTYLTRGTESVLTGTGNRPLKMPCVELTDGSDLGNAADLPSGSQCYFKTWEIGYRSSDKKKFVAFQPNAGEISTRNRNQEGFSGIRAPVYEACDSEKPYYAIRAVFQTDATPQLAEDRITPRDIRGPWTLTGFWVSSCAGKSTFDNRFIYMNVRFQTADICRDLVEVRSKDTVQDAAFTDRVWRESKYSVPILGIQYGQSYAPFSSALNTGPAGDDPLYQTGGKLAGSSSIRPPTFLASGYDTYFGPADPIRAPKDRYAYLSNLFARIYRVYRFNEQTISRTDRVCVAGINQGRKCVPDAPAGTTPPANGPSVECRPITGAGACNTSEPPPASLKVCNALSGINAGRSCGGQPDSCHLYALDPRPTARTARPLLAACQRQSGWTGSGDAYRRESDGRMFSKRAAAGEGAFRCAPGAVKRRNEVATSAMIGLRGTNTTGDALGGGIDRLYTAEGYALTEPTTPSAAPPDPSTYYCTQESEASEECPIEVTGICEKPAGADARTAGTCRVSWEGQVSTPTTVTCYAATDCSFTSENFWRNPTAARIPQANYNMGQLDGRWGIVRSSRASEPMGTLTGCGESCRIRADVIGITSKLFANGTNSTLPTFMSENKRFPGVLPVSPGALARIVLGDDTACNELGLIERAICLAENPLSCEHLPTQDARVACRRDPAGYSNGRSLSATVSRYEIGSCQPLSEFMRITGDQVQLGTCSEGATRAGNLCIAAAPSAGFPYQQWASPASVCAGAPPPAPLPGELPPDRCEAVSVEQAGGVLVPSPRCRLPGDVGADVDVERYYNGLTPAIDLSNRNLNNDNNSCTAEVGYQPDRRICPDPSSEFCGLIAYDMRTTGDRNSLNKNLPNIPLPTDVTLGFYTPSYLGLPTSVVPESAYEYIDYYTPRPPRIAAPAATCPAGMTCGVQDLDRFSFSGITQGILNVVGGQYRSTIKFYGWAAHEQMAIRRLAVDWGDGTVQDFNDVKLKNHKPFCSVQKECYSPSDGFTGLTCQADNDCPVSAQACRAMGSCKDKKNLVCAQDRDCRRDGSQDTCELRAFFGNSAEACEATPFEFSHVYSCAPNAASTLPRCSGQNYVSDTVIVPPPSDVVAPSGGRPGTCYFGAADSFATAGRPRPTCTTAGAAGQVECRRLYGAILGLADVSAPSPLIPAAVFNTISCGPAPSTAVSVLRTPDGNPIVTQARCSRDTTRFCQTDANCAAGDQCIASGIAPPNGCWDDQNDACRFTPRVFVQDNWGWCSGECRVQRTGDTLTDSPTSGIKHPFGGCYTPVSQGADVRTESTRFNTQREVTDSSPNQLIGWRDGGAVGLECSIDRPTGSFGSTGADPRRNFRPWIVFPGSVQLRPRN